MDKLTRREALQKGSIALSGFALGSTALAGAATAAQEFNYPPLAVCVDQRAPEDYPGAGYATGLSVDGGSCDFNGETCDPDAVRVREVPEDPYPIGTTAVTLTVVDRDGATDSCTADVVVYPIPHRVEIDVQPDDADNVIPAGRGATIPVAIFGTSNFDPTEKVIISSVRFGADATVKSGGGARATNDAVTDVNNDGIKDLLLTFPVEGTGFALDDTVARLEGRSTLNRDVIGSDRVSVAS